MKHYTEQEFNSKIEKIREKNKQISYLNSIREEKNSLKKKRETSKLIALYLFALLNAIVIYSMVAMWRFGDLSYLGVLITDIAAQILTYGIYCLKAYKGKKAEEDLKFRRDLEIPGWDEEITTPPEETIEDEQNEI